MYLKISFDKGGSRGDLSFSRANATAYPGAGSEVIFR
jgi:hypothetical protein